mmetsp:Transcript_78833/g.157549  ORF Transcript_78833/g.157549 Transcript_78833/m.157549 type:complete len:120 (-) Transcript_78833:668-1027(-)
MHIVMAAACWSRMSTEGGAPSVVQVGILRGFGSVVRAGFRYVFVYVVVVLKTALPKIWPSVEFEFDLGVGEESAKRCCLKKGEGHENITFGSFKSSNSGLFFCALCVKLIYTHQPGLYS